MYEFYLVLIFTMVLTLSHTVEASTETELISKSILGGFVGFIVLTIIYHCYLKSLRKKEVMAKILREECEIVDETGEYNADVDREYMRSLLGVRLSGATAAKVQIKDKRPYGRGRRSSSPFGSNDVLNAKHSPGMMTV